MLRKLAATCVLATMPCAVLAQDATLASDSGDTGWVLTAAALVLLMTLPGLGLFYGGLVRAKNVLSVLLQIGAVAAVASLLWIVAGYTFAFGTSANGLLGIERGWMFGGLDGLRIVTANRPGGDAQGAKLLLEPLDGGVGLGADGILHLDLKDEMRTAL